MLSCPASLASSFDVFTLWLLKKSRALEVGKTYKIRITRVLQKVAFAEVIGEGSSDSSAEQPQSDDSSESQEPSEGSQESDQQEPSDSDSDNFGEEGEEETQ